MALDLLEAVRTVRLEPKTQWIQEALQLLCDAHGETVHVVAVGGFPVKGDPPCVMGIPVGSPELRKTLLESVGMGAVLTHMNPVSLNLEQLGNVSLELGHDWTLHAIPLTLLFVGCPTFVEMSFGRDGRFHGSWVEPRSSTDWSKPRAFTVSASLKHWKKYLKNKDSRDFLHTQRTWLTRAQREVEHLFPEYFKETL